MLHYLNPKPIYGAEFRVDQGHLLKYVTTTTLGSARKSPGDDDEPLGMWPPAIRKDIALRKRQKGSDKKIHVLRIEPFGACMVVDDVVSHQTVNLKSRKDWGEDEQVRLKLTKFVQAREVTGAQGLWLQDYDDGDRSMSDEESDEDEVQQRRTETQTAKRQFFRIWITVSPVSAKVKY